MTPEEIRAAIAADPALQAIKSDSAALSDHATFAGRVRVGSVVRADFAGWAAATGMRSTIEDLAATQGHPFRDSALAILDVLRGGAEGIDLAKAQNVAILDAWEGAGVLTPTHRAALELLAEVSDPVPELDIRRAIWNDDGSAAV